MRTHLPPRLLTLVLAVVLVGASCGGGDDPQDGADGGEQSLDAVKPATVQILAEGEIRDFEGASGFESTGSGFVVDPEGYVVTNNHVVTGAGSLKVFMDGEDDDEIPAKIIGVSECNDLAVIQLTDEDDYPTLSWSTEAVEPPLEVYAAGFPLGDPEFTMTKGVVSKAETSGDTNWASVREVIEHDAAIQPGNSGGPLVDAQGGVVGVNYAGGDPGTGTSQYFAINSSDASDIVEKLKEGDDESIGVNGEAIVDEEAGVAGVYVRGVAPGGIASEAGVEPGDLITTLNGVALESGTLAEYCDVLRSNDLTDAMSIRVIRSDTEEVLEGELNGTGLEAVFSFASELADEVPTDTGTQAEAPSTDYVEITDDTESLIVRVPDNWADVDTAPQDVIGDGSSSPTILAAPSLADFNADTGPGMGMFLVQNTGGVTAEELLAEVAASIDCAETNRADYSDPVFTGRYAEFDCETVLGLVVVAVPDSDPSQIVLVAATAASEADLRAIDEILASFNIL